MRGWAGLHDGRSGDPPGFAPVLDRRAGDEGEKETHHQKLFAEGQREHGKPLQERSGGRKFFGATMDTAAALRCQTGGRGKFARRVGTLAVVAGLGLVAVSRGAEPPPPSWQNELDVLRLSDAAVPLLSRTRMADAADADQRLGELFRQLASRYPHEAAVRRAAGDHFWRTGETRVAVGEWEAAQALDPADAETADALGGARLRDGQTRLACEQFRRAVAARPGVARYHFQLGNVLYLFRHQLAGLPDLPDETAVVREALAQLRSARDLAAGNMEFARAYAETFYGVPDPNWSEALEAWEQVRSLSGDAPDFPLSHLARVSLRLGRPEDAEQYLAMIHHPGFAGLQATLRRQAASLRKRAAGSE